MASSGKKGKTKWKSVPLVEVCGTGLPRKTTNWVDQVDSDLNGELFDYSHKTEKVVLPTAPRAARAPENEAKVPKEPPFQAYISNLPYEITEDELTAFFHDMKIKSVRLPRDDRGNRARGFGYVEFEDRQSLLSALGLGDMPLKGRRMRIEVAEHSDMNRMGKGPRDSNKGGDPDRTMGDWRSGPRNEDREDRDSYRGGSRRDFGGGGSGFSRRDGDRGGFRDRDGFSDRGGGFSDRGGSGFRDRGRDREYNRDDYGGGGFRDSDRGYRDSDRSYYSERRDRDGDRGGGGGGGGGAGAGAGTWRREMDRDRDRDRERDRGDSLPPPEKNEPRTRTKLNLQPRTKPIEDIVVKEDSADEAPAATMTASSIFGGARPVDTAAREREIEERLAREREEKLEEAARLKTGPPPSKDRDKDRDRDKEKDREQGPPPPREDSQPPPSSRNLEPAPPPKENPWGRRTQPPPQVNNGRVSPREESDSSSKQRDTTPPPPPSHRQAGKDDAKEPDLQKKYQPPRKHQQDTEQKRNRDDDRKRGGGPAQRGGSSAGGPAGGGPARTGEGRQNTTRTREARKDSSGDEVSRMPKLQEHVAPNFAASNKFAFLDDADVAPEED